MQALVVLVCLFGISSAAHIDFSPYNVTAMALFASSDEDHDGTFSRAELDKVFLKYDTNDDGKVSRHEYTIHITQDNPELSQFSHVLYDDYDVNGDHHLDKADYDAYYAKLDANNDGAVSDKEFATYWEKIFYDNEHLHANHGHHGHPV